MRCIILGYGWTMALPDTITFLFMIIQEANKLELLYLFHFTGLVP